MKHKLHVFSFILLCISASYSCAKKIHSITLFNGTDLSGWSVQCKEEDKSKQYWSVKDGTIECNSLGDKNHDYCWLQHDDEFSDFELTLKFRAFRESKGNSGVQVRSRYDKTFNGGWLDGPQIDINPNTPYRNGLIYDETRTEKRWIDPHLPDWRIKPDQGSQHYAFRFSDDGDGWNEMRIVCKNSNIKTWVNGIQVRDFKGKGILDDANHQKLNVGMKGHIALQLHAHDELKIQFKDLYLTEI